MKKKSISMIVLFAFLHSLFTGCAKTTVVQQDKLGVESMECCVYEVILTTGEKYEFEKPGGRYYIIPHLLRGTLNDGRNFSLDLIDENIKEIRISTGQSISRVDLSKNPDQTISEITVGDNIYTFDQNGGRLKAEVEMIHGKIKSGVEIDVPLEDILHVKVKRVSAGRTAALVVGVILIVMVAVVIVIIKTTSPMGNSEMEEFELGGPI
ncbi:MAG: hypothetical protein ACQ9MH_19420 [Nitrospinales bacterium]